MKIEKQANVYGRRIQHIINLQVYEYGTYTNLEPFTILYRNNLDGMRQKKANIKNKRK